MPIVSGFVVPKMNPTSHVGKIRLLRPVVMAIEWQEDGQAENDDTNDAEEPEEILHIVSEVGSTEPPILSKVVQGERRTKNKS